MPVDALIGFFKFSSTQFCRETGRFLSVWPANSEHTADALRGCPAARYCKMENFTFSIWLIMF